MTTSDRQTLLERFLAEPTRQVEVGQRLQALPWDCEVELVSVSRQHVAAVLTCYLDGSMTAAEVEQWANFIEGRDDIEVDAGARQDVGAVLHRLANPILEGALTSTWARDALQVLSHRGRS